VGSNSPRSETMRQESSSKASFCPARGRLGSTRPNRRSLAFLPRGETLFFRLVILQPRLGRSFFIFLPFSYVFSGCPMETFQVPLPASVRPKEALLLTSSPLVSFPLATPRCYLKEGCLPPPGLLFSRLASVLRFVAPQGVK